MKLFRTTQGILLENESIFQLEDISWDDLINRDDLYAYLQDSQFSPSNLTQIDPSTIQAPLENQEIWAAGVTYYRSRSARMEESGDGGDIYDRVYDAQRPELFFKAPSHRTVGTHQKVFIRKDSSWNVPEPELTLFITSNGKIVGYSIGNDMSSRSIEGENPLYLPQAKTYDHSAALGPCLWVSSAPIAQDTTITLEIIRDRQAVFKEEVSISQMKRGHQELVDYLYKECSFPHGCYLMTGTGIVPPNEFTLEVNDEIRVTIQPIGTLINFVSQKTT